MTDSEVPRFAGRTYRFEVDNGVVFRNTYGPDGKNLHWEGIEGPTAGQSGTEDLHVSEIAPDIYFVSWTEASTEMTISHVMDLHTNTVHAFWTYEAEGRRVGELHTGFLHPG